MTPRRITALALLIATGAALLAAPGRVAAHEEVPGVRAVLDAIEPALPAGVTVQVRISASDQLIVENTTAKELEVLGSQGELLFRIGPGGTLANLRSPDWYRSLNPGGLAEVPPEADPKAAPRLARVTKDPAWGWFDHRLHEVPLTRPPDAEGRDVVILETWEIPMRYAGADVSVQGHREFRPRSGEFGYEILDAPEALQVAVLPGPVPAVSVKAPGDERIEVLGAAGEPFARFDDSGVEVNTASPTWALTDAGRSGAEAPEPQGVGEAPRWRREGASRQLTWLEQRAVYEPGTPPAEAAKAGEPTDLFEWEIPVVVDGAPGTVRGLTRWVPRASTASTGGGPAKPGSPDGGGDDPLLVGGLLGGAGLALAAIAWLVSRMRASNRRRGDG